MTIKNRPFRLLSPEELYGILRVRAEVFVSGQKCLYVDPDGKNLDAVQVISEEFLDEGMPHKGMELRISR